MPARNVNHCYTSEKVWCVRPAFSFPSFFLLYRYRPYFGNFRDQRRFSFKDEGHKIRFQREKREKKEVTKSEETAANLHADN